MPDCLGRQAGFQLLRHEPLHMLRRQIGEPGQAKRRVQMFGDEPAVRAKGGELDRTLGVLRQPTLREILKEGLGGFPKCPGVDTGHHIGQPPLGDMAIAAYDFPPRASPDELHDGVARPWMLAPCRRLVGTTPPTPPDDAALRHLSPLLDGRDQRTIIVPNCEYLIVLALGATARATGLHMAAE